MPSANLSVYRKVNSGVYKLKHFRQCRPRYMYIGTRYLI